MTRATITLNENMFTSKTSHSLQRLLCSEFLKATLYTLQPMSGYEPTSSVLLVDACTRFLWYKQPENHFHTIKVEQAICSDDNSSLFGSK